MMLIVLEIDATEFLKNVNDYVKKGDILGYYRGKEVKSNIDGKIVGVIFDDETHTLKIIIEGE